MAEDLHELHMGVHDDTTTDDRRAFDALCGALQQESAAASSAPVRKVGLRYVQDPGLYYLVHVLTLVSINTG